MNERDVTSVLVLASETERPATPRVWGTGGWLPPEDREALDWVTLAQLLGWGVALTPRGDASLEDDLSQVGAWIVVACDPDTLGSSVVDQLSATLAARAIGVIARAASPTSPLAQLAGVARTPGSGAGSELVWTGPGPQHRWHCRKPIEAAGLETLLATVQWAILDSMPLIVARRAGRGIVVSLGLHPSRARDAAGACTALLRHLLVCGLNQPAAWLDFESTLVLRMDDPGGAQNIHSRQWCYPKLTETQWAEVAAHLQKRNARLSIGYVSGWVDDGDGVRGKLEVGDHSPPRVPGAVYPSPLVKYCDLAGHRPGTIYDYQSEFRGIQNLRGAGLGDVELHGYTHMHPDTAAWAAAPDRYDGWPQTSWYRELGKAAQPVLAARSPEQHPIALGITTLREYFHTPPTTLICPGDLWTLDIADRALDFGLRLIGSYYLAIRNANQFYWSQHVCAPYLNVPDSAWFDAGLPVVVYFHDYELALEGVSWMPHWLDQWHIAGARRFIDFRELAAALGRHVHVEEQDGGQRLTVISDVGAPALVRPLIVAVRWTERQVPARLSVSVDGRNLLLPVDRATPCLGHVVIPAQPVAGDAPEIM